MAAIKATKTIAIMQAMEAVKVMDGLISQMLMTVKLISRKLLHKWLLKRRNSPSKSCWKSQMRKMALAALEMMQLSRYRRRRRRERFKRGMMEAGEMPSGVQLKKKRKMIKVMVVRVMIGPALAKMMGMLLLKRRKHLLSCQIMQLMELNKKSRQKMTLQTLVRLRVQASIQRLSNSLQSLKLSLQPHS